MPVNTVTCRARAWQVFYRLRRIRSSRSGVGDSVGFANLLLGRPDLLHCVFPIWRGDGFNILFELSQSIEPVFRRVFAALIFWAREIQFDDHQAEPKGGDASHRPKAPAPAQVVWRAKREFS